MGDQIPEGRGCCNVEAVVTVDSRGQVVLPKDVRDSLGIEAGEKLALISMKRGSRVCCLSLVKIGELSGMVREYLGPVAREIAQGDPS